MASLQFSTAMASPARLTRRMRGSPTAQPSLTDDLLEEIFLRLPEAADLARTSVACATFRRVITDHPFLRRFRALHPPPLLGILSGHFIPAQPPHPSAAAARAFAFAASAAADFSCSFLPSPDSWVPCDFRDGRVLLSDVRKRTSRGYDPRAFLEDLAVCDPLHRRYLLLPAIPDDLAALLHQPDIVKFEHFLCPGGEDEEDTSFRVICLAQCVASLVVFIFSMSTGQWHAVEFDGWSDLTTGFSNPYPPTEIELSRRCYAHRCFCWVMRSMNQLLVLDTRRMEFSAVNQLPIESSDGHC